MPAINPSTIPQERHVAIILRHAERFDITSMKNALDILLTEKGKEDARKLGSNFSLAGPVYLYHSPVPRCRETAEMIGKGMTSEGNSASILGTEMNLGGPYIKGDWKEITVQVEKLGQDQFIRNWFSGAYPRDLILPLDEAADIHVALLLEQLKKNNGTYINVSHDWNILILREHFFSINHENMGMPDFMDGMSLYHEDRQVCLQYHNQKIYLTS